MILIPIVALLVGFLLAGLFASPITGPNATYVAVAVVAGLDSIFGALRSVTERRFRNDVFVTGFAVNIAIALGLAWFGDKIGVNLYLAAVVVMGMRIFTNLALIRRYLITKVQDSMQKQALTESAKQMESSTRSNPPSSDATGGTPR